MKDPLYLDANAHVPMSKATLKAYSEFNNTLAAHGHPLSPSATGRAAASAIEEARAKIAELIGAISPTQIVFTNSCTQACEWAALIGSWKSGQLQVRASYMEHPAMMQALQKHWQEKIFSYNISQDGIVLIDKDKDKSGWDWIKVGVCLHMQNEIGTIQPIDQLAEKYIISDMSQSLGKMKINVTELNVDLAVFGGHKFGGPNGIGFMYLKDTGDWREFGTGSRYYMDISGSPNVGAIVATAAALDEATQTIEKRRENMVAFQNHLEPRLKGLGFEIIGDGVERCPNTTFAKVPGKRSAGLLLMNELGKQNIHVGLGSACGSIYAGGSPLMEALGRPSDGQDYIRISQFGEYGAQEADRLLGTINGAL